MKGFLQKIYVLFTKKKNNFLIYGNTNSEVMKMELNKIYPNLHISIDSINTNSKEKRPNSLFVAIKGKDFDGHDFINEAITNGAICVVSEKDLDIDVPLILVSDSRLELAILSSYFYDFPSKKMNLVGVTGTDGKTTTSSILSFLIHSSGYIGTNGIRYKDVKLDSSNTTPDSLTINALLDDMHKENIKNVFMEVSSHSVSLKRISYIDFDALIFTNLSHEHLDYYKTMENYFMAKAMAFKALRNDALAIINIDDEYGLRLSKMLNCRIKTYSMKNKSDLQLLNIRHGKMVKFDLLRDKKIYTDMETNLQGDYNLYNLLAVISYLIEYGYNMRIIRNMIRNIPEIEGRMNLINEEGPKTIIDFAHTPNALYNILQTAREITKANLILVMGAAGERDSSKRPIMGEIATNMADFVIFTEEDNHNENPNKILSELTSKATKNNFVVVEKRKDAIKYAFKIASFKDTILITGKGNEKTMSIKNIVVDYNDITEARKYLSGGNILN